MRLKHKNKRREEAIEYLNIPSWSESEKEQINYKSKKKFDVHFSSSEKDKLSEIQEKVEVLQPKNKKGKRKRIWQIGSLIFCSLVSVIILSFIDNSSSVPINEVNISFSKILMVLLMLGIVILFDSFKYIYLIWVTTKKFRPFTSFKVGIVGRYYDSITPLATGGQPFQMYYLSKRDVPVGVASSIPLLRYFTGQLAIMFIALYLMFFVPLSERVTGVLDMTTFSVTKSAAYIGLAVTSFLPMFIMFLSLMPKLGKKVTAGILKLGSKLKLVKNYDLKYNKVIKHVDEFQNSMRYFSSNAVHIIILMILTAVEYIAFLSIPYFICLAFGETASLQLYLSILALNVFTTFAVTLMPTPGTSGAAETVFLLIFRALFSQGAFWAMLIWRFMTYYIFIIIGLIVMFYDFIKQTTKEKFIERRKYFNIREKLIPKLNSESSSDRLANLTVIKQIEREDRFFVPQPREYDIKISLKTEYSCMPFKPSYLAYKLHEAGSQIAGIMDHETLAGAKEFFEACNILGIKCLIGVQAKTYISRNKKRNIRINNLNQKDIVNLCMTCIPYESIKKVDEWLKKYRDRRNERNRKMLDSINKKYKYYGITLDFEKDILPVSAYDEGGTVTEWHLIYALAQKMIERFGRGQILLRFLTSELSVTLTEKMKQHLLDVTDNKIYLYDLINILKTEIKYFYIDANEECCSILEFIKMAKDTGSIVAYPYMGDIIHHVMGEYRVEKFEDSFLEELLSELKDLGVNAVTFEPSRLTDEQTLNIMKLCDKYELMQLSGETIYSVRQSFENYMLEDEKFEVLHNTAWALAGNVKAIENGKESGLFSPSTIEKYPQLSTRIMIYSTLGKYGKIREN
ncbi:MAG: flippase-like domain-containing protein [Clostridia bacterium]|nr:flippase-like domain-containing protein [Clostridia bacterium]